jgi:hypothetical protein
MMSKAGLPEDPVTRTYDRRLAGGIGWASLLLFLGPLVLEVFARRVGLPWLQLSAGAATITTLLLAPLVGLVAAYLRVFGLRSRAHLEPTERGARLVGAGRAKSFARAEIQGGFVTPVANGAAVELELTNGRAVATTVPSVAQGDALLRSLKLDASQRRTRVSLADHGRRVMAGIAATSAWFGGSMWIAMTIFRALHVPNPLPVSVLSLLMASWALVPWLVMRSTTPPTVSVGAEGITIERSFGRRRSIPFDQVREVVRARKGILLELADGERVTLGQSWGESGERVESLLHRLEQALDRRANVPIADARVALLERGDRDITEWMAALRKLGAADAGYRGVALMPEELEQVLSSEGSSAEAMLGAALALREVEPDAASEHVRIAAARVGNDRVRIALEGIAAGDRDDQAVQEALAEFDGTAGRASAKSRA